MDINELILKMPKIELHRHLSGAVTSKAMYRIASDLGIEAEGGTEEEFTKLTSIYGGEKGFQVFLKKFKARARFYKQKELISLVIKNVIENIAQENILHLELRFSASHFSRHMKFNMKETTEQIISTSLEQARNCGMSIAFLMTLTRDLPIEENQELLDIAVLSELNSHFSGIDIAGDEENIPLDTLEPLIHTAVDKGKKVTIHAGEAGPASNVSQAINLGASRIGHGIRAFNDPDVLQQAVEAGITFEVCPTSNIQTASIEKIEALNLSRLIENGVQITINTDDPGISGTDLVKEFSIIQQVFSLTAEDIQKLTLNAVKGAYVSDAEKEELGTKVNAFFA
jgi:adenosine deaminase